jgi:histidine ammonia-lyase
VRKWDEDRFFAPDIEAAKGLVQAGTFLTYAAGLLPSTVTETA